MTGLCRCLALDLTSLFDAVCPGLALGRTSRSTCVTLDETSLAAGLCACATLDHTSLSKTLFCRPEVLPPRIRVNAPLRKAETSAPDGLPPRKGLLRRLLPLPSLGLYCTIQGRLPSPRTGSHFTVQGPLPFGHLDTVSRRVGLAPGTLFFLLLTAQWRGSR